MNLKIPAFLYLFLFGLVSYAQSEIYEIRVYEMKFGTPEAILHDYFKDALIPALKRLNIPKVGAFEETGENMPKKIYLLIPYKNIQEFVDISDTLEFDKEFLSAAESYNNTAQDRIPFLRYESRLIRSTWGFSNLVAPAEGLDQFELRIYESKNEDALRRKLKMFNENEFEIFKNVGLNTVFFGKNITGDQMPSLTYLLAFEDKEDHQKAWSNFGNNAEWKRISALEEFKNTVSSITRIYLRALPYSEL